MTTRTPEILDLNREQRVSRTLLRTYCDHRVLERLTSCSLRYGWALTQFSTNALKRSIDLLGAVSILVFLAPVFILTAILIKRHDGGPVLYWQTRIGRWGREFPFPKFRSMVVDAESLQDHLLDQNDHGSGVTFKMKNDPRITWIGKIIRRLSIDELPQVWCVIRGDMSIVGPRPPLPREVQQYSLQDRRRLDVTPGLTCIWQVSGRSQLPFPEQLEMDVAYIERRGIWFDLSLIFRTIPAVLKGKGAC